MGPTVIVKIKSGKITCTNTVLRKKTVKFNCKNRSVQGRSYSGVRWSPMKDDVDRSGCTQLYFDHKVNR